MAKHEILDYFEHRREGWICTRAFTLTTKRESIEIRAGRRFGYGERIGGLDLAEYLERLGSQFGS